jgi:hypothetical protein
LTHGSVAARKVYHALEEIAGAYSFQIRGRALLNIEISSLKQCQKKQHVVLLKRRMLPASPSPFPSIGTGVQDNLLSGNSQFTHRDFWLQGLILALIGETEKQPY